MKETRLGNKRDDLVYIPTEARIRLLVTGERFEVGGQIEDGDGFEEAVRKQVSEALSAALLTTFSTPDGQMRIGTIAIGEFEPAAPK